MAWSAAAAAQTVRLGSAGRGPWRFSAGRGRFGAGRRPGLHRGTDDRACHDEDFSNRSRYHEDSASTHSQQPLTDVSATRGPRWSGWWTPAIWRCIRRWWLLAPQLASYCIAGRCGAGRFSRRRRLSRLRDARGLASHRLWRCLGPESRSSIVHTGRRGQGYSAAVVRLPAGLVLRLLYRRVHRRSTLVSLSSRSARQRDRWARLGRDLG